MSLTVSSVIDRIFLDFLLPPSEQPIQVALDTSIDDTTTSVSYVASQLTSEELELFDVGVLIEIAQELMQVTDHNQSTAILTVRRGARGTTATAHTADDIITLSPTFARKTIFDAVSDCVSDLFPSLYHVTSTSITTSNSPIDAPADSIYPIECIYQSGTSYFSTQVQQINPFPDSATNIAWFISAPTGKSGHVTYKAEFSLPTAESDTLASLNIDDRWADILVTGAILRFIGSRDFDPLVQEHLIEQLATQLNPTGTATDLRNQLIRHYEYLVNQARRRLVATYPEQLQYVRP